MIKLATLSKLQLFNWHLHSGHHLEKPKEECVFCSNDLFRIGITLRQLGYPVRKITSDHLDIEGTQSVDAKSRGLDTKEELALFTLLSGGKRLPRRKSPARYERQQKMLKRECLIGIYKIECSVNHKIYIGKSTDIHKRWKAHIEVLNSRKHNNRSLQRDWDLYGHSAFTFEIIELCTRESALQSKEFEWISYFNSSEKSYGYNVTPGGVSEYQIYQDKKMLSDEDLLNIRQELLQIQEQKIEIAKQFGIRPVTLARIASGKMFSEKTKIQPSLKKKAKYHQTANILGKSPADLVHTKCLEHIRLFLLRKEHNEADYRSLKTFGTDAFSKLKRQELEEILDSSTVHEVLGSNLPDSAQLTTLRWIARGLPIHFAINKARYDQSLSHKFAKRPQ